MFLTQPFQEFMEKEQSFYIPLQQHLNMILYYPNIMQADQMQFTYQSVYQLFCHLSQLQNAQVQVMQGLMKMFGSIVEQPTKNTSKVNTKIAMPNFFDIFEDKHSHQVQPLQQEQKKQSDQTEIEQPKDKVFREAVRNKKERSFLEAHSCNDCENFYKAVPGDADKIKQDFSRHRANHKINQEKLLLTPE